MKKTHSLLLILLFFAFSTTLFSQQLKLNTDLVVRGRAYVTAFAEDPNGGYLVAGLMDHVNGTPVSNLIRIDENGNADPNFQRVVVNDHILQLKVLANGKILVAGSFFKLNDVGGRLFRLNSNGAIDNSFVPFQVGNVSSIVIQSSGKIVLGGTFSSGDYQNLIRLNTDGTVDNTFAPVPDVASGARIEADASENIYFPTSVGINKVDMNGVQATFGFPVAISGTYYHVLRVLQNKVYLGGYLDSVDHVARKGVAVIYTNGILDDQLSFPNADGAFRIAVFDDGRLLQIKNQQLQVYHSDGTIDKITAQGNFEQIFIDKSQRVFYTHGFNENARHLNRLTTSFEHDTTFYSDISMSDGIESIEADTKGRILLAGNTQLLGIDNTTKRLIRLLPTGEPDTSFTSTIDREEIAAIEPLFTGKVLVATKDKLFRLHEFGEIDTSFHAPTFEYRSSLASMATINNSIFLGGFFEPGNDLTINGLVKLHEDGTIDPSFKSGLGNSFVGAFAFQSDGKIIVSGSLTYDDATYDCLRLNPDGSVDPEFTKGLAVNGIDAIAIDKQDRIYIGGCLHYNNIHTDGAVRLHPNGTVDNSFIPDIDYRHSEDVTTIQLLNDTLVLVGRNQWYVSRSLMLFNDKGVLIDTLLTKFDRNSGVSASNFSNGILCFAGRFIADGQVSPIAYMKTNLDRQPQVISYTGALNKTYGEAPFPVGLTASSGLPVQVASNNPEVLTITEGVATIHKGGDADIIAFQAGDLTFGSADTTFTVHVNKANQIISFDPIGKKQYGDEPFALAVQSNTQIPISISTTDTTILKIENKTATIRKAGTVAITASQVGDDRYLASSATVDLFIDKAPQAITFDSIPAKNQIDEPFALQAEASSALPVTFLISDESVASISDGTVTILSAGEVTITASQSGNHNYYPAKAVTRVLLVQLVTEIETQDDDMEIYPNPGDGLYTINMPQLNEQNRITLTGTDGTSFNLAITPGKTEFDIRHLPSGFYILTIKASQGVKRLKLIKNN